MIFWVAGAVAAFYLLYRKNAPVVPRPRIPRETAPLEGNGAPVSQSAGSVRLAPAPVAVGNPFREDPLPEIPDDFKGSFDDLMPEPAPEETTSDGFGDVEDDGDVDGGDQDVVEDRETEEEN